MPYSTFLSLRYLSNIRPTSELLSGYKDAPPARPRGVATLKVNYKGQFHNIDFYIVNHEASVIVGLPTCIKLNLITPGKDYAHRRHSVAQLPEQSTSINGGERESRGRRRLHQHHHH